MRLSEAKWHIVIVEEDDWPVYIGPFRSRDRARKVEEVLNARDLLASAYIEPLTAPRKSIQTETS